MKRLKLLISSLRAKRLKRKGYNYYTITVDGVLDSMIFYKGNY